MTLATRSPDPTGRRRFMRTFSRLTLAGPLLKLGTWPTAGLAQQNLPAFDFFDLSGRAIPPNDPSNQLLYLDFWASWCGPCRQSFPWMNDMHATYGKRGLRILAVNLDKNKSNAERFLREVPASFQIAWDPEGKSALAHQVKAMPTSLVIACRGSGVNRHSGFSASMTAALEADIKSGLCRA